MDISDEQLVLRVKSGEFSLYQHLFERYQKQIYNFAYNILGSNEDAKDITQEAFVKVFEALPKIKKKLNFSAYLYKTTHNLAVDELKKRKRMGAPEILDVKEDTNIYSHPQKNLLLKEQQSQVRNAAMNLSEDYRTILTLKELDSLSYQQISFIMQIPKNQVGVLLLRARLKFKQEFRMAQIDVERLSKECRRMLPLLSGYIDNELTDKQKEKVKSHLKDCPFCQLALEEMLDASRTYRGIVPLIPPPTLKAEALEQINKQCKPKMPILDEKTHPNPQLPQPNILSKITQLSRTKKLLLVLTTLVVIAGGALGGFYSLKALKKNSSPSPQHFQVEKKHLSTPEKKRRFKEQQVEEANTTSEPLTTEELKQDNKNKTLVPQSTPPKENPVNQQPPPQVQEQTTDSPEQNQSSAPEQSDVNPPPTPTLISPPNDSLISNPNVTLEWSSVNDTSGVTYVIEIQYFAGGGEGYYPLELKKELVSNSYPHTVGALHERWRVWAVDGAGNQGSKTDWWYVTLYASDDSY
jgi:RNA polymerase sigma-70 factor (ECF subfamily)